MTQFDPLDAIAYIDIKLYADGGLKVSGNIGDVKLALDMLKHAMDAVKGQLKLRTATGLLLPPANVGVEIHPAFPLTPYGDVAPELRPLQEHEKEKA